MAGLREKFSNTLHAFKSALTAVGSVIFSIKDGNDVASLEAETGGRIKFSEIQQKLGNYYYMSDTAGDEIDDLRFSNSSGAFIFEVCTVANATKGSGTWVQMFTTNLTENTLLIGDAGDFLTEITTIDGTAGTATLVAGVYTLIDANITTSSIVAIGESSTGTYNGQLLYTLSAGQCVFDSSDIGDTLKFSYNIIY